MRRLTLVLLLIALAGCNLATSDVPATATFGPLPTTSYIPPTPYRAPTLVNGVPVQPEGNVPGAQGVVVVTSTPLPGQVVIALTATPVPGQIVVQTPNTQPNSSVIDALVNNLIIPAWNLLYTFFLDGLSTLWQFAGARGGGFAQVFCCIAPAILAVVALAARFRLIRWRRR